MSKRTVIFIIFAIIAIITLVITQRLFFSDSKPISYYASGKDLVNQAILLKLPEPDKVLSDEALSISGQAFSKVEEGNYGKALEIALEGLKKFPKDLTLQAEFAVLLGDYSSHFSSLLKEKMIQRSKEIFDKLLPEAPSQSKNWFDWFKNEYYFRFGKYKEQYELGLKRVVENWGTPDWTPSGYYSQGVGAAQYARELTKQGNHKLAYDYAQKALIAWAQYFSYKNSYYNAYVHYALALGILGYRNDMMKALQRGADLIKNDLDFPEFKEVIEFIDEYK